MAIINFPNEWKHGEATFYQKYFVNTDLTGGGDTLAAEIAPSLWMATYTTQETLASEIAGCYSFLSKLKEGVGDAFYGPDPLRILPYAYRLGTGLTPPGGWESGDITHIDTDRQGVRFQNLGASQIITEGDYFYIEKSGRRYLFRATNSRTATGPGAITDFLRITPALPASIVVTDNGIFENPFAIMRPIPGSIDYGRMKGHAGQVLSFQAMQVFKQ